jgi:demethylmenaquinone methyltransferase/2-methoxy-6-polyprenyl-1,4-benzoquinol methylase
MQATEKGAASVMPDTGSTQTKKEQVAEMFNNIAGNYDFLNHFLSLGIDKTWRKKAVAIVASVKPARVLDVATGTGDMAIAAAHATNAFVSGVDIAVQMMDKGRDKIKTAGLEQRIELSEGDSEHLAFDSDSFDAVMCAYGVRNFEHLEAGLREMARVMRPGGQLAILEFSRPTVFPIKQLYGFYFKAILPTIGKLFSRHNRAYTYLPESVNAFPDGDKFCKVLEACGFKAAKARPLTFGVTTLYTAVK